MSALAATLHHLRLQLTDWRVENDHIESAATEVNLQRLPWLAPILAALCLLNVIVFAVRLWRLAEPGPAEQWMSGLLLAHGAMVPLLLAVAWLARRWQHLARRWTGRSLSLLAFALGPLFATTLASIDQWVTPSITPYLLGCMGASLVLYQRPLKSGVLLALSYLLFFHTIDLAQESAEAVLSNRVNGLFSCAMAWVLSLLMWRQFSALTLHQENLSRLNAELQQKQQELERLTRVDGLTGVLNRNTFVELTQRELARARRQGTATTLLLLDLDHFKRVNDSWGHPCGDAVLRHMASLCSSSLRSTDLVGRLGGEEFIILLPGTSIEAGRRIAEKLRQQIQNTPVDFQGIQVQVTVSIGLAGNTPQQKQDFEILYSEADKALYLAKEWGRNRVV